MDRKNEEITELKAKLAKGSELLDKGEVTILSEENPVLVEEIENLRKDLATCKESVLQAPTKHEVQTLKEELTKMTNAKNILATKLDEVVTSNIDMVEKSDEIINENTILESRIVNHKETIISLTAELNETADYKQRYLDLRSEFVKSLEKFSSE